MAYISGGSAWDFGSGWITKKDPAAALKTQAANDPGAVGMVGGGTASKAIPLIAGVGLGAIASWIFGGGSKKDATLTTSQAATQQTLPTLHIEPYGINVPTTNNIKVWQPEYIYNPQVQIDSPYASMSSAITSKKDTTVSPDTAPNPVIYQTTTPSLAQTATPSVTQTDTGMGNIFTYLIVGVIAIAGIYVMSSAFKPKKDKTENSK